MTSAIPVQRSNQLSYQANWETNPFAFKVSNVNELLLKWNESLLAKLRLLKTEWTLIVGE